MQPTLIITFVALSLFLLSIASFATGMSRYPMSDEDRRDILESCVKSAEGHESAQAWMKAFNACTKEKKAVVSVCNEKWKSCGKEKPDDDGGY